jgi:hypothetical protein
MKTVLAFSALVAATFAQHRHGDCYVDTYEARYDLNPLANDTVKGTFNNTYYNDLYTFEIGFCQNQGTCGNSQGSIVGSDANNGKCAVVARWPDESQHYIRGNTSSDANAVEFQLTGDATFISRYYIICDPSTHLSLDNVIEEPQNEFRFLMRSRFVCNSYDQHYSGMMMDLVTGATDQISIEFNPTGDIYVQIQDYDRHGVVGQYYFDKQRQDYVGALFDTDDREYLGDIVLRPINNGDRLDGLFYDKFENIYEIRAEAQH